MGKMGIDGETEPWLAKARATMQDAINAADYATAMTVTDTLRRDPLLWHQAWAPATAIAARELGRPDARQFLDEAIAGGFSQPELFEPLLTDAFGTDNDWPELLKAMADNVPPPPISIDSWPRRDYGPPLDLNRLSAEREQLLRERLPAPKGRAWETAVAMLAWVNTKWSHTNAHVDGNDAIEILDRVDAGERFACREYTIVLTQALNAVGVPARGLLVAQANAYHGVGRGHAVTEAWIDDLGTWVVLDGQNGMYWVDAQRNPLGGAELSDLYAAGSAPAQHICVGRVGLTDKEAAGWWRHFDQVGTVALSWQPRFVPFLDTAMVNRAGTLLHDRALAYPDLSQWSVGVTERSDAPALTFDSPHPYAVEFVATLDTRQWTIPIGGDWTVITDKPGSHELSVATRTRYGVLESRTVAYTVG